MNVSFSGDTKNSLCAMKCKRRCCRRALLYGMRLFSRPQQQENPAVSELERTLEASFPEFQAGSEGETEKLDLSLFECQECSRHFLRGVFLACGTITDPGRGYHLELTAPTDALCGELEGMLCENSLPPKRRGKNTSLYYKESESVEDFLNFIGAQKAAFDVVNVKIYKDLRNNANRLANCDTANIDKSVSAAQLHIEAIESLSASGGLDRLPDELRATAELRTAYPDVSLSALAELHDPPITKSGVNHRLQKLVELAKKGE